MISCASGQRPSKVNAFLNVNDTIHHISGLDLCFMVHQTKFPKSVIFDLFSFSFQILTQYTEMKMDVVCMLAVWAMTDLA